MFKIKREMNLTITKPYYTRKKLMHHNDNLIFYQIYLYKMFNIGFDTVNLYYKPFDPSNKPSVILNNLEYNTEFDRIVNEFYYINYKKMI